MTRLPHDNRNVKGRDDFPSPILEPVCHHPFCSETNGLERHHIWRRSFFGGAYNAIELWDGTVVSNVALLCHVHHREITENKAQLRLELDHGRWFFLWCDVHSKQYGTLSPHPQTLAVSQETLANHLTDYSVGGHEKFETPTTILHSSPGEGEECPVCHRKVPVKKKREKSKNRVTYSFRVPKDKVEDGSDVLEELVVEVEKTLKPGEDPRPMYYTLCDALGLVLVNKDVIL